MKNLLLLTVIAFFMYSCDKIDEPELLGTYTNLPEECDPSANPEFNCSRLIIFSADGVAEILYGGDVFSRTSYKIKGDKIKIEKNDQFGLDLTFKKLDDGSLREEGDKSIWVKQEG